MEDPIWVVTTYRYRRYYWGERGVFFRLVVLFVGSAGVVEVLR